MHTSDPRLVEEVGSRVSRRMGIELDDEGCQLCGGMFSRIRSMAEGAASRLSGLQLRSFYVSVRIPPEMRDLEDEVRSSLRLPAGLSAKRLAIRMLSEELSRILGVPADPRSPDAVLEFTPEGLASVRLAPMYLEGRYVKRAGEEVRVIDGGEVGRSISASIARALEAEDVRMIWIGTDFRDVEVSGRGRPFLVKVLGARRRLSWPLALEDEHIVCLKEIRGRDLSRLAGRALHDVLAIEVHGPPELARRLESLEGSRLGADRPRRVVRAVVSYKDGVVRALLCVEHGVDLSPVIGDGQRRSVRLVDVVESCEGYPLGGSIK